MLAHTGIISFRMALLDRCKTSRWIVRISCSSALQPAHNARQLPSCRYHVNCARLLQGSHDGDNSGFYIGTALRAWNLRRLPRFGATCAIRCGAGNRRRPGREAGADSRNQRAGRSDQSRRGGCARDPGHWAGLRLMERHTGSALFVDNKTGRWKHMPAGHWAQSQNLPFVKHQGVG
jgi:hypothetical protein